MPPDHLIDAGKTTAPSLAVSGLALFNVPLQEWVYIVTIAFTLWQFGLSIRKFIKERRK